MDLRIRRLLEDIQLTKNEFRFVDIYPRSFYRIFFTLVYDQHTAYSISHDDFLGYLSPSLKQFSSFISFHFHLLHLLF